MASFYYGSGLTWTGYLQADSFVRDITGQIRKSGEANRHKISAQTREIIASNERLSHEFGRGFDAVNGTLEIGFNRLESALGNVEASIDSLHSDFNYNMGLVLDQLQIQNQLTFGILERLDAIHKTLEHPELTKAREFYNRGCERLSKGLLDKALEAFLKAEEKNDTDFFIQFQIGKLYLYGVDEDDNVIYLPKAVKYLRDAARYGKAEVAVMPEFWQLTGDALFHASIACYAQANDQRINGNTVEAKEFIFEAFNLAEQACDINPFLSESQYHLAKYAALLGDVETSLQSLEKAITQDIAYCIKADIDQDFNNVRPQILKLFERVQKEKIEKTHREQMRYEENVKKKMINKRKKAHILIEQRRKHLTDYVYISDDAKKVKKNISKLILESENKIEKNTLRDFADAIYFLDDVKILFKSLPAGSVISKEEYEKQKHVEGKEERKRDGLCSICGAKLSFWDKLRGRTTCSKHSS